MGGRGGANYGGGGGGGGKYEVFDGVKISKEAQKYGITKAEVDAYNERAIGEEKITKEDIEKYNIYAKELDKAIAEPIQKITIGTEKQIKYANDIRNQVYANNELNEAYLNERGKRRIKTTKIDLKTIDSYEFKAKALLKNSVTIGKEKLPDSIKTADMSKKMNHPIWEIRKIYRLKGNDAAKVINFNK